LAYIEYLTMPFPETLEQSPTPKIIFFTDFDGTITLKDTNDYITDNHGFGHAKRREGNKLILDETDSFRDGFQKMLDSWKLPFPEVIEILKKNIKLDPHFKTFVHWAKENHVPVIVLSSGMIPVIHALLEEFLGIEETKDIEIVANGVQTKAPNHSLDKADGWTIDFHDDSSFGHDKSLTIRPYAKAIAKLSENERTTLLYAGDGVSDLSAARETDLLFAKEGHDLIVYCEREGIPFTTFNDWSGILQETKDIYEGKKSVKKVAAECLQRARTNSLTQNGHPVQNGSAK
jgi:2,3-diketo-5-methylthio-1-phosphopentane phosphatase